MREHVRKKCFPLRMPLSLSQPIPYFYFVTHASSHALVSMKQPSLFAYLNLKQNKTI